MRSARGNVFPGSRISLPVKVTLVQAVWAKSGPTIALPKMTRSASAPTIVKPGWASCGVQPLAHESHQAEERAAQVAFQPNESPTTIRPINAAVLAKVKVFCTSLPISSPRVFTQVRRKMRSTATSCSVERLIAYAPKRLIGRTR